MAASEEEFSALKRKVQQLEQEAQNRVRLVESNIAQNEATLRSFASRCFATGVAWATSQMVFKIIIAAMGEALGPAELFFARSIYAALAVLICPFVLFFSRPSGPWANGITFLPDFVGLISTCTPMILSWALMDVFLALRSWWDQPGWDEFVSVTVLTLIVACAEMLPCFGRAKKAVHAGEDVVVNRFQVLPTFLVLTLGRLWHEFARYLLSLLLEHEPFVDEAGERQRLSKFFVELIYSSIIMYGVTYVTAWWSERSSAFQEREEEVKEESMMEALFMELEEHAGQLVISALAFVYAWALSFLLQDFFFEVLWECSPKQCASPVHFCYAAVITVMKTTLTMNLEFQDRDRPWGKASQTLAILANSLCVGWAWKGFLEKFIFELSLEWGGREVYCYVFLFAGLWALAGNQWHRFLKDARRRARTRQRDFEKTRAVVEKEPAPKE